MIAISLQSGSNGNCIYVESHGVRLLFDAGISGIQTERRLFAHRREVRKINAVIISHDHSDHVRCAGVLSRKYKLPVHVSDKTRRAAHTLEGVENVSEFRSGATLHFGAVTVETLRTPHDAADGVVFIVSDGQKRLGILTDLGHVFDGLSDAVASLDGVFIESNYDPEMLANGPYPQRLQRRVRGPGGHLSNLEAAELLLAAASKRMKWVCLGHLSHNNNTPKLALETHRTVIGNRWPLHVATRHAPTDVLEV